MMHCYTFFRYKYKQTIINLFDNYIRISTILNNIRQVKMAITYLLTIRIRNNLKNANYIITTYKEVTTD